MHLIRVTSHLGVRLPATPATRGALDNEELFIIEGSKTDTWRSTPENWRSAKKWRKMRLPATFQVKSTLSMTESETPPLLQRRQHNRRNCNCGNSTVFCAVWTNNAPVWQKQRA